MADNDIPPKKLSPPAISKKDSKTKENSLTKVALEEAEKAILCHPDEIHLNHCENNIETENSPKVENINNCDSSKDLIANKVITEVPKPTDDTKESKERRVTFIVENNDSNSERSESVCEIDEDIPTLQEIKEGSLAETQTLPEEDQTESLKNDSKEDKENIECSTEFESIAAVEIEERDS